MIGSTVTEFQHSMMEENIEESIKMATKTVMDSRSILITMSMTVNSGRGLADTEKECSRRHQLEELKEDFMKEMKSKKSLN